MADLPEVALRTIFDFLSIQMRMRARLTCKKWKFVIETSNLPRSVCIYQNSYPRNEKWTFSGQKVRKSELVKLRFDRENRYRLDFQMDFLRNLQVVYLYHIGEEADRLLEAMSQLSRLKVLIIERSSIKLKTLSSSGLEKLALKHNRFEVLQLDTPNLASLILWQRSFGTAIEFAELLFPLKLKHLECLRFEPSLFQLKNLETLVCLKITIDFRLNDFKSLKRIGLWSLDEFRMVREQKERLNRKALEITASGFKEDLLVAEPVEAQDNFFCARARDVPVWLTAHYLAKIETNSVDLVGSTPWEFRITFPTFARHTGRIQRVRRDFFDKFQIGYISLRNAGHFHEKPLDKNELDQSDLVELLKASKPSEFNLDLDLDFSLKPRFFEQLASIRSIKVMSEVAHLKDIHYLLNFKNLECFSISFEKISIDFLCAIVRKLKFLKFLKFSYFYQVTPNKRFFISLEFRKPYEQVKRRGYPICLNIFDNDYYPFTLNYFYTDQYPGNNNMDILKHCKCLEKLIEEIKRMPEVEIIRCFFA